jgi:imidazolonepropionase
VVSLAVINIGELTTNDPKIGRGATGRRERAGVVIDGSRVVWVGDSNAVPAADIAIDAMGAAVLPGFVDSHTHLVFAGDRSGEFESRLAGLRYDGGGILSTVDDTRAATQIELDNLARARLGEMRRQGTTTVEIKSGYGLSVDCERTLCEVARGLTDEVTFLGAHALPREYVNRRTEYVELVGTSMLDACSPLCRWADVFCDIGAFDVDESRSVLLAARAAGLGLRIHANQLADSGGIALAVELGAASVDHCTFMSTRDRDLLSGGDTVVTLLPGAEFCTQSRYPDARALIEASVPVALATDCNPGTSYVTSMPFVIALAVREMGLSVDEAVLAATLGGARALRRDDVGHLGVGARGDLSILEAPRAAHIAYRPGSNLTRCVLRGGVPVDMAPDASAREVT